MGKIIRYVQIPEGYWFNVPEIDGLKVYDYKKEKLVEPSQCEVPFITLIKNRAFPETIEEASDWFFEFTKDTPDGYWYFCYYYPDPVCVLFSEKDIVVDYWRKSK